jgi:DHA2 family multidrug resistance protein-like MFS transporter
MMGNPQTTPSNAEDLTAQDMRALFAIFLGVMLSALDVALINTALPAVARELNIAPALSIWIVNAYQLAVVASLLPFAALGDRIGPKKVFLGGVVIYTLASLGCVLAGSLPQLAFARALQGIGSAGVMSVNIALVRLIYPPNRLGRGVGLNALVVGLGSSLGPTVASAVLSMGNWPWLFALNLPLGVLALVMGLRYIPKAMGQGHPVDTVTAGLSAVTFAALIFAMTSAAQRTGWPTVVSALALALVAGYLLLRRQSGHPAPMLPVDLFKRPLFALSAMTSACSFTVQGIAFVSLPFYLQTVLHRSAVETGLLITPWAVVVALAAPFAGRLSDKHAPGLLGGVGLAVLCLGMVSMAMLTPQASTLDIVARMMICGAGFGFFQSPNLKALMSAAPPERSSGASGIIALARLTGQTTGAALVALCFGLGAERGPLWALGLGAGFAAVASVASFARLRFK